MPLRISKPKTEKFPLSECDPTGETYIVVKEARQAEFEDRMRALNPDASVVRTGMGEVETIRPVNLADVIYIELYLTLADCNIEDEDGSLLLAYENGQYMGAMADFIVECRKLPISVIAEMSQKVLQMNPLWKTTTE